MNRQHIPLRRMMRKIINAFLQGLLFIAPVSVTIFVIYKVFVFVDNLIPVRIPGLGLLIVLAAITLIGLAGSFIIRTPLSMLLNRILENIPLVKILYSAIKDLMSAFVGQKKKFNKPVRVLMNSESRIYKLGFMTLEDLSSIGVGSDMVAVYLPHSYNFSGNLFLVPASSVEPINAPAAEVMKFIVSGGVTRV
jgi:uncharacterized membrane protein